MLIPKDPHQRIGQFLFNFLEWLNVEKGYGIGQCGDRCADPFYIEDEEFEALMQEYSLSIKP